MSIFPLLLEQFLFDFGDQFRFIINKFGSPKVTQQSPVGSSSLRSQIFDLLKVSPNKKAEAKETLNWFLQDAQVLKFQRNPEQVKQKFSRNSWTKRCSTRNDHLHVWNRFVEWLGSPKILPAAPAPLLEIGIFEVLPVNLSLRNCTYTFASFYSMLSRHYFSNSSNSGLSFCTLLSLF